jgi:hypothetical protein
MADPISLVWEQYDVMTENGMICAHFMIDKCAVSLTDLTD